MLLQVEVPILDDLPLESCGAFERELYRFVENAHPDILARIREKKTIDDQLKGDMTAALNEFKQRFVSERKAAAEVSA